MKFARRMKFAGASGLRSSVSFVRESWIYLLVVVALLYLTLVPVGFLVYGSFVTRIGGGEFTTQNYAKALLNQGTRELIFNTLVFAIGSSLVALVFGGVAAWIVQRTNTGLKAITTAVSIMPLLIPTIFYAMAWISLLGPRAGLINVWLADLFHLDRGPFPIFSMGGMIWVEGLHDAPFAFLLMSAVFRSMDPTLEEAAAVSGAGVWTTIRRITLRLALPGILSVFLFRFIRGIESFEVPLLIGVPKGIDVFTTKIFGEVVFQRAYGVANAYAIQLVGLAVLGIVLYRWLTRLGYQYSTVTGRGFQYGQRDLGNWRFLALAYLVFYLMVIAILPLGMLVWDSLTPYPMRPSFDALSSITLDNFGRAWELPQVQLAVRNTALIAGVTVVATMLIAGIISWITVKTRVRGRSVLDMLAFVPLTIPGVTLGVALLWIYLRSPIPIFGTIWLLVIGYVTAFIPHGTRFTSPAVMQIHNDLEESAYVCGASRWVSFRRIIAPLILPALLGGGLYIFLLVFRVASMAIVVYTPDTVVLPVLVINQWLGGKANVLEALGVLVILGLTPFALLYYWLIRRYGLGQRGA